MECTLCNKEYVGKAEIAFNIRLNAMSRTKIRILHASIFKIKDTTSTSTQSTLRQILTEKENHWIGEPKTLHPQGQNQELSK